MVLLHYGNAKRGFEAIFIGFFFLGGGVVMKCVGQEET